jgi:hypothetical protein
MNVHLLWLVGALVALAALAVAMRPRRRTAGARLDTSWPLEPKGTLLSEAEQQLYRRLVQALRFKRGQWSALHQAGTARRARGVG